MQTVIDTLGRAARAVAKFTREREPVAVVSSIAAVVVAVTTEWQGDLTGQSAWIGVLWGVATLVARQQVTPTAKVDELVDRAVAGPPVAGALRQAPHRRR